MNTYLALIVATACIAWTMTNEALFTRLQSLLSSRAQRFQTGVLWLSRKLRVQASSRFGWWLAGLGWALHYMPTCDYCLSHWLMLGLMLLVQPAPLVGEGVVGFGLTYFVLVAGAVLLTTLFRLLRQVVRRLASESSYREFQMAREQGWAQKERALDDSPPPVVAEEGGCGCDG